VQEEYQTHKSHTGDPGIKPENNFLKFGFCFTRYCGKCQEEIDNCYHQKRSCYQDSTGFIKQRHDNTCSNCQCCNNFILKDVPVEMISRPDYISKFITLGEGIISGPEGTEHVLLDPKGTTLGRGSDCDIVLDDNNVSRSPVWNGIR